MSLERRVAMKKYVRTRLSWMVTPVWGFGHLYLLVILRRQHISCRNRKLRRHHRPITNYSQQNYTNQKNYLAHHAFIVAITT